MTIKKLTGDDHPGKIEGYESHYESLSGAHDDIVSDIRWLAHRDMPRVCFSGQSQRCDQCLEEFTIQVMSV